MRRARRATPEAACCSAKLADLKGVAVPPSSSDHGHEDVDHRIEAIDPAGGDAFYAVRRIGAKIYEPRPGWERRIVNVHPWPAGLFLATMA